MYASEELKDKYLRHLLISPWADQYFIIPCQIVFQSIDLSSFMPRVIHSHKG